MAGKIRFEAFYPSKPEEVWVAITDPVALGAWLMPNDFQAVVGHRFTFTTKPAPGFDGVVHCEVLELNKPRRVAFTWKGGGIDTIVSFDLFAEKGGTRVVMEQAGFKGMRGAMIKNILKGGWRGMIEERLPATAALVKHGFYGGPTTPAACD